MGLGLQIGQCRIQVDTERTKAFYATLPFISENCTCDDCVYFENEVIQKDIRLFKILKSMEVDLKRQPNINPDGVCSFGPTEKYQKAYLGYYQVYGQLRKTQNKTQIRNEDGKLVSVDFYEPSDDAYVHFKIVQKEDDLLEIEFFLECEKLI